MRVQHLRASPAASGPVQGNSGHVFRFETLHPSPGSDLTAADFKTCNLPTVNMFTADELEKRRRQRQKKVREEKRRERRIEMEENKKQGKCK